MAVTDPPTRVPNSPVVTHRQGLPLVRRHRIDADLDGSSVAAEAGAEHLEGALFRRPDQVGGEVVLACRVREGPLGRSEVVLDEGRAAGLDEFQVAPDAAAAAERTDCPIGPVRHRDLQRDGGPVHENLRRPVGGVDDDDPAQCVEIVAIESQHPAHRRLGRPPPQSRLVVAFCVRHGCEAAGEGGVEPGVVRRNLIDSGRMPSDPGVGHCSSPSCSNSRATPRFTASMRNGRSKRGSMMW